MIGEMLLVDCARRNGIASDTLDVGLHQPALSGLGDVPGELASETPPASDAADGDVAPVAEDPSDPPLPTSTR